jgi:cysteinyl-tRNA synthetase
MSYHELDTYIRANTDHYRLYDWQQIEQMRNDLAAYGAGLSEFNFVKSQVSELVDAIIKLRQELRDEKNYALSDRLRDILTASGYNIADVKK